MKLFLISCCLLLSTKPATRSDMCMQDASGQCVAGIGAEHNKSIAEAIDVNELMQRRIRVDNLSPGDYAPKDQALVDMYSAVESHQECKVDRFGLIQAANPDEPYAEQAEQVEQEGYHDMNFDDSEFTGEEFIRNYMEDPELQPYLEEIALLEERVKSEMESPEDEDDEDSEGKILTQQDAIRDMFDSAAKEQNIADRKLKMTDLPTPPAALQSAAALSHTSSSGVNLVTELVVKQINCPHNVKEWVGHYEDPKICAEKVFAKGYTYFVISTKSGWRHCELLKTAKPLCPDGQTYHHDLATYKTYEKNKPIIFDMYPQEGSLAGGQLVTFRGAYLYEAHDEMEGKKDTASALKAPIQIMFTNPKETVNMTLECPMENFESRGTELKCVTPPLTGDLLFLRDIPLSILIYKVAGTTVTAARVPLAEDTSKVLSFIYSSGATPELKSVSPVSAGPGQIITIQAFSCSGIVEGDPVQLVKIGGETGNTSVSDNTSTAESNELVPDLETAFGHICEPWPPVSERKNPTEANKGILSSMEEAEFGAIGLDAMEFKLPDRKLPKNLVDFIREQPVTTAARWIQPKPWLSYAKYWRNIKQPYVAKLTGKLKIQKEGTYWFMMSCLRKGYFKLNGLPQKGIDRNKGYEANWGHHGRIISKSFLNDGWHDVEWVHAVNMDHPHHSALEVHYKGPDTGDQYRKIPESKLRALITREAVEKFEQDRLAMLDHQEKYLVPAKEIFGHKAKGLGLGTQCPPLPGSNERLAPKLVEFKCKVSADMEPGFYDIRFQDHEFGESITPKSAQWLSPDNEMATMRVVPVIKKVTEYSNGNILVEGHGLDGLQDSIASYGGHKYINNGNSTQDYIVLAKGPFFSEEGVKMGARGLLREWWYSYDEPENLEAQGLTPAWQRASKMKTEIMVAPGLERAGFSERLTGLLVPPFSGTCRWRMKGKSGANNAKLFFNEKSMSELSVVVPAPAPPPLPSPFLLYAGRDFSGNNDFENLLSGYTGPEIGGALSIAFTTKFEPHACCWQRVIDFGNGANQQNILIARRGGGKDLQFEVKASTGHHGRNTIAHNNIRYGHTQRWLITASEEGTYKIFLEGILVAQCLGCLTIPKVKRKNMYVAKSNWDNDKYWKGSIKNLRFYDQVVRFKDVFEEVVRKDVNYKLFRYERHCAHNTEKDLGWKSSPAECAEEAQKQGHEFFRFGRYRDFGKCIGEGVQCDHLHHSSHWNVYKILLTPIPPAKIVELLPFPADPVVAISDNAEKKSDYFNIEEGKAYPIKLERKVAARTEDTGSNGWDSLGLECKSLLGDDANKLPQASYRMIAKLKKYKVAITLPESSAGYDVTFKGRTEAITTDAGAGGSFMSIFGPKCTVTAGGDSIKFRQEFMYGYGYSTDAYCGSGLMKAPLHGKTKMWQKSEVPLMQTNYKLRDYKFLHVCYKIEPRARVNMIVKAKVGYHGWEQMFSIGMTDPWSSFSHEYKRAAQFPITVVNGTTTGMWECKSIDLYSQIMDYDSYDRRFHHVRYDLALNNPGHHHAPGKMLDDMTIMEFKLGTYRNDGAKLEGMSYVDTLVVSSEQFAVARQPSSYNGNLPWASVSGVKTTAGWTVEWFKDDRGFLFKPGSSGDSYKPTKVTYHEKLALENCEPAKPEFPNCYNYGWRATATISLPANKDVRFYYWNDDDMQIYVNDQSIGRLHCCNKRWNRWRNFKTGAAGDYKVEVHMWGGGGANYGYIRWWYDNQFYDVAASGKTGVTRNHKIVFEPTSRTKMNETKAFLAQVSFTPKGSGETLATGISFLPGIPPPAQITVESPPPESEWTEAAMLKYEGIDSEKIDVGKQQFNEMFKECPVVKYMHNDVLHSIYVRTSAIPDDFDAYTTFTASWMSKDNVLNRDFKIYSNDQDMHNQQNAWKYCNYDDRNVGYPRDCGPHGGMGCKWFRFQSRGGPCNGYAQSGFWLQTGGCTSPIGTNYTAPKTASFAMSASSENISKAIMSVGYPDMDATVFDADGMRWLDLSKATATQISTAHSGIAERAIDGFPGRTKWNQNSCTHTHHARTPWWTVNFGGKVNVERVMIKSRSDCCANQLRHASIAIDGKVCHQNLQISEGEEKYVPCVGYGSTLSVFMPNRNTVMAICEVRIGTFDGVPAYAFDAESDIFGLTMAYLQSGSTPPPLFSSAIAEKLDVETVSSGTRFFTDITDSMLRMAHHEEQVSFPGWSDYICAVDSTTGCAPVAAKEPPGNTGNTSNTSNTSNTTIMLQERAMVRVTTHNRRHPQRKWRLPPRFHTEESLEKMRRRVFGYAKNVYGWSETAALLQGHVGSQKRFSTVDPRADPNMMKWSAPSSWGGEAPPNKDTTDIVYIPEGKTAQLDMNVNIRFWVIEGNVVWDQTKDLHMEAEAIVVNGGQLLIGSETEPYAKWGQITLHGHWHTFKLPLCGAKAIFQTRGNIEMHGIPVPTTWSQLDLTAMPDDYEIYVQGKLDWKPGNMIVIAASDKLVMDCRLDRRDDCQVEERFIEDIREGPTSANEFGGPTTIISLDRPLVYRHLAEEYDPMFGEDYCERNTDDPKLCGMTQVRAEVGLISRNLVVKGSNYADGSGPAGSEGFGGHLMHAEKAKYSYVEFFWMGQAFQMGRYPIHLHLTGLNPTSYIKGCSLRRTFMRGITVHGTHSATIKDNVLYNVMAHGYFIEDGNEHNNVFDNNLGMMVHRSFSVLVSDQTPAVFWLRNPNNLFTNNHAAGGAAFGFWFDTLGEAAPLGIKKFENNVAHSNGNTGIWIDIVDPREDCTASPQWKIKVPSRDSSEISRPVHENPPQCGGKFRKIEKLLHTTTWGNGRFGMTLFETGHFQLINHRSVNDKTGILVWGIQSDDWPDPTNGFNGPSLLHGSYRTVSGLDEYFPSMCSIGGPWDDTLMVYGQQFIGKVSRGHFCPCFECLAEEGGYTTRTGELGWHIGAGTRESKKASWPWLYSTMFFDLDGTLTTDETDYNCQQHGCYLHAPFDGARAGMYSRRDTTVTTTTAPPVSGPLPISKVWGLKNGGGGGDGDDDVNSGRLLQSGEDLITDEAIDHDYDPGLFAQISSDTQQLVECRSQLSGMKEVQITASTYHHNQAKYGKGQMWRSKLDFEDDPTYCGNRNSQEYIQYSFEEPVWVTGVQTKGRYRHDQWITKYKIQYTLDGQQWHILDKTFQGNRNRNTIQENRFQPMKVKQIRLYMSGYHGHNCMRLDFLGCSTDLPLTMTCMDKPYLDQKQRNCAALERDIGSTEMQAFCNSSAGAISMHTALSAKQACCACGAGVNVVAQDLKSTNNSVTEVPANAPIKVVPGGTGYFDPNLCKVVDETGGIVCKRSTHMNSITVTSAGIWHMMTPIEVQTDFGFSEIKLAFCYQQYEFTVMNGNRYLMIPPYTPKKLVDWDRFDAEIKMSAGDKYVLQWETIHNPDGYTVEMSNVHKESICDKAEMQYDASFNNNNTLIDILKTETDMHSVQKLKLSQGYIFDMYKVAHLPLLDRADSATSAGMWGYIQANESLDYRYWYPGMFNALITEKGVTYSRNHIGPWNGKKRHPLEKFPTRDVNNKAVAAQFGFSQIKTPFSWKRWDLALPPINKAPPPQVKTSRLLFLVEYCGFNPASFEHYSPEAVAAVTNHPDVKNGKVKVPTARKFKWSEWPAELGGKPTKKNDLEGLGNVSIEADWEVTIDEDVDFINKLNISGVLKFEDKPNCCKLVARYVFVGPLFGKIEAGTEENPITQGIAHIILKGQPMTPPLRHFRPHMWGAAKWLKSKFLAVQGSLSLHGATRSKTWVRIAKSVSPEDTEIFVEGGDFKAGDVITIDHGVETKKVTSVVTESAGTKLVLDSAVKNAYRGADHVYNGRSETTGWMAAHVGLVDGYRVIVEGEDTPGVPMCHKSKTQRCPYANSLGGTTGGMNLHDFAKEMRHYLEKTGAAAHPNCRPCGAVSEMGFAGYIIGMAHYPWYKNCPKDHGVIDVTGVAFKHGSNLRLYHGYTGGNYPYDLASKDFPGAWNSKPIAWWTDPVWEELKLQEPPVPQHQIAYSAFNNSHCGAAFALANAGLQVFPTKPVTDNVIFSSAVGINGAARPIRDIAANHFDFASPMNDNFHTMTEGVGSPSDFGTFGATLKHRQGASDFVFVRNMLSASTLVNFRGGGGSRVVTDNIINGPVYLDGCPTGEGAQCFASNVINSPATPGCINMNSWDKLGVSDNTVFGCKIAVAFNFNKNRQSTVRRMKILDSNVGVHYWAQGPDSKSHNAAREEFAVTDVTLYAKPSGAGVGIRNPIVHADILGQPVPDWWHGGSNFFPMGHSAPSLYFKSMLHSITFIGYTHGTALTVGGGHQGDTSDSDYYPVFTRDLKFEDTPAENYMKFAKTEGAGFGVKKCIQIDCDGRRNSLVVDEDGSLIGEVGTVISTDHKFYDKMGYVDPMGFDTMEDLIPMPARYDAVGDAIPFPTGVDHGTGGGLEYMCMGEDGCEVLYMERRGELAGQWMPNENQTFAAGEKIVAVREDGGHIFLDPLHHGWDYALGTVITELTVKTMDPKDTNKPESQHARRYGRVGVGEFGTHLNASKIPATSGPVYTTPGIYREGCSLNADWGAYECPKGRHRHLLIEVMDWNHMVRRWAPVSVEVNDKYAPQGGAMNVLTGPAMYWTQPMMRLQTFHALGHVNLRHNVYFSADPPSHLRLHLQYADPQEGIVACVYYGLPNTIQAYVGGAKKAPLMHPTWDNLVFHELKPNMEHGTYYYDRVGVETRRPGYLYTVLRGGHHSDFKISHKIVLTSKITVTSTWGGWDNDKLKNGSDNNANNDFYKRGINGLVRNIALLIGAPPSRVAILGQGRAKNGTFWNADTTSEEFAQWMWTQNKSMDRKTMKELNSTPGAKLKNNVKLAQMRHRHTAFLQKFSESSRSAAAEALAQEGPESDSWSNNVALLSTEEQAMLYERRATDMLEARGEAHYQVLRSLQERAWSMDDDSTTDADSATFIIDTDSINVPPTIDCDPNNMLSCAVLEEHEKNQDQLKTEDDGMKLLDTCQHANKSDCVLPGANFSANVTGATIDKVPNKHNPKGWHCNASLYNDGMNCDCDCGIWDPDCDLKEVILSPTIMNSTNQILLMDAEQAFGAISWVDKNYDSVIGADEVPLITSLGASSLYSMARTIVNAQELGENKEGYKRRGNFAWLDAVESNSCSKLLADAPLTAKLATYTPMCVKDDKFLILDEPQGRCSLQPKMQVGSQCTVPGGGWFPSPPRGVNQTTEQSVCGAMLRVFGGGFGIGGTSGAGQGPSSAQWFNEGGTMVPKAQGALPPIDMKTVKNGLSKLTDGISSFKHGMSFYCKIKFNSWHKWGRIFSLIARPRQNPGPWEGYLEAEVHNGDDSKDNAQSMPVKFWDQQNYHGRRRNTRGEVITPALPLNQEVQLLFVMAPDTLAVWKNGNKIASADNRRKDGFADFDKMKLIIGAHGNNPDNHMLDADIHDIRVWNRPVTWDVAIQGAPPTTEPAAAHQQDDDGEEIEVPCITSKKNTWDFACQEDLGEDLAKQFGYDDWTSKSEIQRFENREKLGDVTKCTAKASTKGVVFTGKFGDGLTAEYYRMRTDCHRAPFTFGSIPAIVRVDPEVKVPTDFKAPYNEFAILWSGKILINTAGSYFFELTANDGAWLAIDSLMSTRVTGCRGGSSTKTETSQGIQLSAGGHDIAILYFNRGPAGATAADPMITLKYKGPDTSNTKTLVPTSNLGSDPLRLAKLSRDTEDTKANTNMTVTPLGKFVYDEEYNVAIMPKDSCDLDCERGLRKPSAAAFKFFCKVATDVSFVAQVSDHSEDAMIWWDESSEVGTWKLKSGLFLSQTNASIAEVSETMTDDLKLQYSLGTGMFKQTHKLGQDYRLVASAESPSKKLLAGTHTLYFQGRPASGHMFALKYLEFAKGKDECVFYLEGSDVSYDQC